MTVAEARSFVWSSLQAGVLAGAPPTSMSVPSSIGGEGNPAPPVPLPAPSHREQPTRKPDHSGGCRLARSRPALRRHVQQPRSVGLAARRCARLCATLLIVIVVVVAWSTAIFAHDHSLVHERPGAFVNY